MYTPRPKKDLSCCRRCKVLKTNENTYMYKESFTTYCKSCTLDLAREVRDSRTYGADQKTFADLLADQNNLCAICKTPHLHAPTKKWGRASLAVDHDHTTGKIRGLLCFQCNTGLGRLGDTLERAEAAVSYLRKAQDAEVQRSYGAP